MTRMLASVKDPAEAAKALTGGADIIDCKDPARGALGALPPRVIERIVTRVARRRPVSATIGDVPAIPTALCAGVVRTAACGVDYVKLGFFEEAPLAACLAELAPLARGLSLIAVFFADRFVPRARLAEVAAAGFAGVMLDTADKQAAPLPQLLDRQTYTDFVATARELGLLTGLAGRLQPEHLPELLPARPDYLGFRSALCPDGRNGALSGDAMALVRAQLGAGVAAG